MFIAVNTQETFTWNNRNTEICRWTYSVPFHKSHFKNSSFLSDERVTRWGRASFNIYLLFGSGWVTIFVVLSRASKPKRDKPNRTPKPRLFWQKEPNCRIERFSSKEPKPEHIFLLVVVFCNWGLTNATWLHNTTTNS